MDVVVGPAGGTEVCFFCRWKQGEPKTKNSKAWVGDKREDLIFVCFCCFLICCFFVFGPLAYLVMMQFLEICLKCGLIGAISSQSLVAVLPSLVLYRYSDERDCYLHQDETPKDCLIKFSKSILDSTKTYWRIYTMKFVSCVGGIVQHVLGYLLGLSSDDLTWKWFNAGLFKRRFEVATRYLFWVVQCFLVQNHPKKWNDLTMWQPSWCITTIPAFGCFIKVMSVMSPWMCCFTSSRLIWSCTVPLIDSKAFATWRSSWWQVEWFQQKKSQVQVSDLLKKMLYTLPPRIMEVENGCVWKVAIVGGTHFSLPWLFEKG